MAATVDGLDGGQKALAAVAPIWPQSQLLDGGHVAAVEGTVAAAIEPQDVKGEHVEQQQVAGRLPLQVGRLPALKLPLRLDVWRSDVMALAQQLQPAPADVSGGSEHVVVVVVVGVLVDVVGDQTTELADGFEPADGESSRRLTSDELLLGEQLCEEQLLAALDR